MVPSEAGSVKKEAIFFIICLVPLAWHSQDLFDQDQIIFLGKSIFTSSFVTPTHGYFSMIVWMMSNLFEAAPTDTVILKGPGIPAAISVMAANG